MGYHKNEIIKGELGEWSKVIEEWEEFKDAVEQQCSILEICELADLVGAILLYHKRYYLNDEFNIFRVNQMFDIINYYEIEKNILKLREYYTTKDIENIYKILGMITSYTNKKYNISLIDLIKMSELTAEAFKDGLR